MRGTACFLKTYALKVILRLRRKQQPVFSMRTALEALCAPRALLSPTLNSMTRRYKKEIDLDTGVVVRESFWLNARQHRDENDGPADIWRDPVSGKVVSEHYKWRGALHRVNGPAEIGRAENGMIVTEVYWRRGLMHREPKEGPAEIRRHVETGVIVTEGYYLYGRPYRDPADGPRFIRRNFQTD
jgi:hypothetical protein